MSGMVERSRRAVVAALWILLALVASGAAPATFAQDIEVSVPGAEVRRHGGQVAIFQDAHVARGELRRGDVVCIFGDARIEGEITNDLVVIGGNLHISGRVGHDVVAILSTVTIDEGAEVGHDLVNVLGNLDNRGAVLRDTVNIPLFFRPISLKTPFGTIGSILAWFALLLTVFTFLVLLLIAVLAPDRVRVLSEEAPVSYFMAFLVGLGVRVAVLIAHALLWMTIIGIPLSGLLYFALVFAKWMGVAGICHYVGKSMGRAFGRDLSPLGAILVGFLPFSVLILLPMFIGGFGFLLALAFRCAYWILVEIPAVGLVVLTRGGSRPRTTAAWVPPAVADDPMKGTLQSPP